MATFNKAKNIAKKKNPAKNIHYPSGCNSKFYLPLTENEWSSFKIIPKIRKWNSTKLIYGASIHQIPKSDKVL